MAVHADRDGGAAPETRPETCIDRAQSQGYHTLEQIDWWLWMFGCSDYDVNRCEACRHRSEHLKALGGAATDQEVVAYLSALINRAETELIKEN